MSQKKYKSTILIEIYFRASDAFQQLLKQSNTLQNFPIAHSPFQNNSNSTT